MENGSVYNETTEPQVKSPRRPFGCTLPHLRGLIQLKYVIRLQILSLLAVICEEVVEDCIKCSGLYFFEFTSCSAFLLSLLILCVYCTDVYETCGEDKVQRV
ncbi:CKLF6 protein, partial [Grus americana]|nr:CKLF6 protein [Grus americana]